jgi:peptidoglycan/xylan/chitin deacetylase (PgdA/CDA1 family)
MLVTASALSAILLFSAWLSTPLVPQLVGQSFRCVNTQEKVVALTFDDGPRPDGTPAVLDLLARYNIQATFFLIGNRVEQCPELTQRIWQSGHQVGNHTWSHTLMMFKSPSYLRQEIEKTDAILKGLGHPDEIFFRAPYGMKFLLLPLVLRRMNKKNIIFDSVAWDWSSPGVEQIVRNVISSVRPGSIILLHDGVGNQQETIVAVEEIIKQLIEQGYRFVTVAQLLTYDQPISWMNAPYACLATLQGLLHSGTEWVSKKCYGE